MKAAVIILALTLATSARAQTTITSMTLGPNEIGTIRTTPNLSTRIVFSDPVQDVICGDLYDAGSGKGTFVVARGGTDQKPSNDVFIKPIASKGRSNLFVKVGENGKQTFNFVLVVVSEDKAHIAVNVTAPPATASQPDSSSGSETPPVNADLEKRRAEIEQQARQEADEILRNARQQANRITAEAEARVQEAERQVLARGEQVSEERFVQGLMLGLREIKINNPRVTTKRASVTLESRALSFDDKIYLRYTITNNDVKELVFNPVTLEGGPSSKEAQPLTIKVAQTKQENKLDPGESLTGVISLDAKLISAKDRVIFFVRDSDGTEIARINIQ